MFDRQKLVVVVHDRSYEPNRMAYVVVSYAGNSILRSDDWPPGPDLLIAMDRAEKFVRLAREGVEFETAYLTAFPN